MTSHYHYGHAVTGDSPEREGLGTCLTLHCLADCVRRELDHIGDMLAVDAYTQERDAREMLRIRTNGQASDYRGSWESVATRAIAALDCHAMISNVETLRANLDPQRGRAPLYVGQPALWESTLGHLIFESYNFPLYTDSAETRWFQVWECSEPSCDHTHADYPHEPGRLHDCLACETRCYCDGEPACIHCDQHESGECSCAANDCQAHS